MKDSQTQLQEQNNELVADGGSNVSNNVPETLLRRLDAYVPFCLHGEDSHEVVVKPYLQ